MYGIRGKILHVDLTSMKFWVEEPGDIFYRKYIGGRGIALYYLHRDMPKGIDSFDPRNMLIFATSIIAGTPGPAISRLIVCAKSPLTGAFGESEAGGFWTPELKKAGYDALIITGKSEKPVYLWVKDEEVIFKDATHLWGKETGFVQHAIREELNDDRVRIAQIGPGGENLVRFAGIVNELAHFNGRNGLGSVMGSKNLKAIAVRGSKKVPIADKEKVQSIFRWAATEGMKNQSAKILNEIGTPVYINIANLLGVLPTKNWTRGTFKEASEISGEKMKETIGKKSRGCFACPIKCKRVVEVKNDQIDVDPIYGGPEYETIAALGSLLQIGDLRIIAKANELCNKYTIDTISTGMTIAFVMECYGKGLLSKEDCDGLEIRFGNKHIILPLIEKIVWREGIGNLLAEGSLRAANSIGKGSERYVYHVKGQEVPMHDPRSKTGVALQYALADYGADHMKAAHDVYYQEEDSIGTKSTQILGIYEPVDPLSLSGDKVRLYHYLDIYGSLLDCLGACFFGFIPRGPIPIKMLVELVQAITGVDFSLWELMKASERTITMARLFNIREGFSAKDDTLPEIFFENYVDGPLKGKDAIKKDQFYKAIKMRYEMMGWDNRTSKPKQSRLIELGIDWIK